MDDNDIPEVANFFSKRAKFVPKVTAEEFEATSQLLDKIQNEKKEPSVRKVKSLSTKINSKRKVTAKTVCVNPEEIELEEEEEKDDDDDTIVSTEPLSAAARRRLRNLKKKHYEQLKSVEAANKKVLSAVNTPEIEEVDETFDKMCVLTISYFSDFCRMTCCEHEKFSTIFPKVAYTFKLKPREFILCLREKIIKIDDTPKSLNLVDTDILECIPYKAAENAEIEFDVDKFKLCFQSNDSKEKIEILVHKSEQMKDVMERYAETRNIPLNLLLFEFDGDRISDTETPEDLDMESGSCVDVRVLIESEKQPIKKKAAEVFMVESDSDDSDIVIM